jgi:hypothetical protein
VKELRVLDETNDLHMEAQKVFGVWKLIIR